MRNHEASEFRPSVESLPRRKERCDMLTNVEIVRMFIALATAAEYAALLSAISRGRGDAYLARWVRIRMSSKLAA